MNDIVEFIEKRRGSFKNPCFAMEPLWDWVNWSCSNGALFGRITQDSSVESIGIAWKIPTGDYSGKDLVDFSEAYNPFSKEYDVFVLDFFSENKEARKGLLKSMTEAYPEFRQIWAQRHGETVKIPLKYLNLFFNI